MKSKLIYVIVAVLCITFIVGINWSRKRDTSPQAVALATLDNKFRGYIDYTLDDQGNVIMLTIGYRNTRNYLDFIAQLSGGILGIPEPKVMNQDLETIGKLTSLQNLNLESNKITKVEGLDKLTSLQNLNLYNNQITKIEGLDKLTSLQEFYLYNQPIDNIPNMFKTHKKLKIK